MTNTEIIQAIKAEIERLKTVQLKRIQEGDLVDAEPYDKIEAYNELLSFLDTLESKKPLGEEYTIEIGKYTHTLRIGSQSDIDNLIRQEKQEQPSEGLKDEAFNYCFDNGLNLSPRVATDFARYFYDLGCRRTAEKYDEIEYNRQRAEESEKPMNLEEEINRYLREECSDDDEPGIHEIASHFAQWGAKHLADDSKTSPNDLEEAARHSEILTYPMPEDGDIEKVFKVQEARFFHEIGFIAGAKWQKEQDEKEQADLFTIVALDAAQRAKEQMMKEAVCYIAQPDITATGNIVIPFIRIGYTALSRYGIKVGDKVRIIILPKESEQ